jgi:hypothetical protein
MSLQTHRIICSWIDCGQRSVLVAIARHGKTPSSSLIDQMHRPSSRPVMNYSTLWRMKVEGNAPYLG